MAQDGTLTNLIKKYIDPIVNNQNEKINNIENKVNSATNGSPLVADNISDMTQTDKIYVLTTDGYWYYYNGSSWEKGGLYQTSGIGEKQITYNKTDFVSLFSKNKIILTDNTSSAYGITEIQKSLTGILTLNGLSTQRQNFVFGSINEMKTLKPGTYTFDVPVISGSVSSSIAVNIYAKKVSDGSQITLVNKSINQLPYTFTINEDVNISSMGFWIEANRNFVNYTLFPQLHQSHIITENVSGKFYKFTQDYIENFLNYLLNGNIAPENTNFIEYSNLNKIILSTNETNINGLNTISNSKTGILTINGTCNTTMALAFGNIYEMKTLKPGTYTFDVPVISGNVSSSVGATIYAKKVSDDTQITLVNKGTNQLPYTFTIDEDVIITSMSFWVTKDKIFNNWSIMPQLQQTEKIVENVSGKSISLISNYITLTDMYNYLNNINNIKLLLCNNLKAVENKELSIYYGSIMKNGKINQILKTKSNSLINYDNCFRINKKTNTYIEKLTITLNDILQNQLSKNINLNVIPTNSGNGTTKKCLFIGDSMTNAGIYTQKLLDLFNNDDMNIELLGTRGTGTNLHEGRNSWSAYTYTHNASYGDATNPFWNNANNSFDFQYYMNFNNYDSVDIVGIMLGTNDFGIIGSTIEEYVANLQTIINSIHNYNPSIKILLMTPPSVCQLQPDYFSWINSINNSDYAIIDNFDNKENENIIIVPIHYIVDPINDFKTKEEPINNYSTKNRILAQDYIHPANIGYWHMADLLFGYIKYLGI